MLSRGTRGMAWTCMGMGLMWLLAGVLGLLHEKHANTMLLLVAIGVLGACVGTLVIITLLLRRLAAQGRMTIPAGMVALAVCVLLIGSVAHLPFAPKSALAGFDFTPIIDFILGVGSIWTSLTILLRWVPWR